MKVLFAWPGPQPHSRTATTEVRMVEVEVGQSVTEQAAELAFLRSRVAALEAEVRFYMKRADTLEGKLLQAVSEITCPLCGADRVDVRPLEGVPHITDHWPSNCRAIGMSLAEAVGCFPTK